jgi:type I restriction enzyme M protein
VGEQISHDPNELLRKYEQQQESISALRNELKSILDAATPEKNELTPNRRSASPPQLLYI